MKKSPEQLELTLEKLRWLRLPGKLQTLPSILERAAKDNLTVLEVVGHFATRRRRVLLSESASLNACIIRVHLRSCS